MPILTPMTWHCILLMHRVACCVLQAPTIDLQLEMCAVTTTTCRPVPFNAPDCSDLDTDCRARAISGQCDTQLDMLARCQLSCGVCRQVSNSPGCFDSDASCFVAANIQGKCRNDNDTAGMGPQGLGCLLSCGLCQGCGLPRVIDGSQPSPPPNPPPSPR